MKIEGNEEEDPKDSSRKEAPEHRIGFKQEACLPLRPKTREEVMNVSTGKHVGWGDSGQNRQLG